MTTVTYPVELTSEQGVSSMAYYNGKLYGLGPGDSWSDLRFLEIDPATGVLTNMAAFSGKQLYS